MDELWRGASKSQRARAIAAGVVVAWAGALVVDMHYLRARPEFQEKFPGATEPVSIGGLFGGSWWPSSKDKEQQHEEEDEEPEWRRERREREAKAASGPPPPPKQQAPATTTAKRKDGSG